jgi:hypothetical protein
MYNDTMPNWFLFRGNYGTFTVISLKTPCCIVIALQGSSDLSQLCWNCFTGGNEQTIK